MVIPTSWGDRDKKRTADMGDDNPVLKVNDMSQASNQLSVSAESVSFSAGAAGTTGVVALDKAPVMDSTGALVGDTSSTSFSWVTGTVLTNEVKYNTDASDTVQLATLSNGEYAIDYATGKIRYSKATTGTSDTCNYTSRQTNIEITSVSAVSGTEVSHDSVVVSDGPQVMYEAANQDGSALPNAVAEGDAVRPKASLQGVQYVMLVNGDGSAQPAYDSATDSKKGFEISPISDSYASLNLVDTTDIAIGTHYYPSSAGGLMDGYKDFTLTGSFLDADGTLTLTIEVTNDETPSSGTWIDVTKSIYDAKNNATSNASYQVTNGTLTFALDLDNLNYSYYRVVVVASGATNTVVIKGRVKAL